MITSLLIGAITYGVSCMLLKMDCTPSTWEYWSIVFSVVTAYAIGFIDNR